jgi:predicted 3-demethylubiquinone-9 3-methyltransferase (glyoxalase superfamily)
MQKLTPFFWMHGQAEQACQFYTSLFDDASYTVEMPGPNGGAFIVSFTLQGQKYVFMNSTDVYTLSPAFSLQIDCDDQAEVDRIWEAMMDGGTPMACGWITDRFGLTWQVIPRQFFELLNSGTPAESMAVMTAMQTMIKFDVSGLQAAFDGAI